MVLVDTSVWIDYFNGVITPTTHMLDQLLGSGRILTGELILAEILRGFTRETDYRRARDLLADLPCADLVGKPLALAAADHYRKLRAQGFTVRKTIDVLIGTFCIVRSHELPTLNQGLVRFLDSRKGASAASHDVRTDATIAAINASGEAFFSGTTWRGMRAMRISVVNWRTTDADVERTINAVRQALDK